MTDLFEYWDKLSWSNSQFTSPGFKPKIPHVEGMKLLIYPDTKNH